MTPIKSTTSTTVEVPEIVSKKNLYVLYYRYKNQPHPLIKNFFHEGDLKSAIADGKNHCEATNLVFLMVRPFLSDLRLDEKKHFGQDY